MITHAHAEGIAGALFVALATAGAIHGRPSLEILEAAAAPCRAERFSSRVERAQSWLATERSPPSPELARQLGNGVAASESRVTAIFLALRFREQKFDDLLAFFRELGGDVDTIGAMSGAVWGALQGREKLPPSSLAQLEQHARMESLAAARYHPAPLARGTNPSSNTDSPPSG
jgi:poly(ADP-ribose) glycohydrolase ARH3